jgi:hypothetical protein
VIFGHDEGEHDENHGARAGDDHHHGIGERGLDLAAELLLALGEVGEPIAAPRASMPPASPERTIAT